MKWAVEAEIGPAYIHVEAQQKPKELKSFLINFVIPRCSDSSCHLRSVKSCCHFIFISFFLCQQTGSLLTAFHLRVGDVAEEMLLTWTSVRIYLNLSVWLIFKWFLPCFTLGKILLKFYGWLQHRVLCIYILVQLLSYSIYILEYMSIYMHYVDG